MKEELITIIDENNQKKDYKVLLIIDKEYKYIIYTNIDNNDLRHNLYVAKVKSLDNINDTMEITSSEWEMIEKEYQSILDVNK